MSTRAQPLQAWLFLAPALILLAVFSFWPVAYGSLLAFTDYSLVRETSWVGLDNFRYIFDNEMFVTGLKNSLLFLLMVPFVQIGAITLAVLVNNQLPGIRYFRAAFYVPVVTTVSVVGIMWGFMFHEQGSLNYVFLQLKLANAPIGWLTDDTLALFAVMFVTLWRGLGWYMVMYLAALQAIPRDMQEAALLDGANRWQQFWRITVPMLRPTIAVCSILSVLAALKAYQEVDVLTQGGPMNSTFTALYYAYDQGLKHLKLPRALAASMVVSVMLCALALVCVFPFWWTLVTALSTEGNVFAYPPTFWPQAPSLANFAEVFRAIPIMAFFRNSVLIAALTVFWKLALCSLAAYPLARMQFRGRKLVFGIILATLVLPSEVNFLVNFITVTKLSLVDTYTGVILPNVVTAVAILLLKQAFEEVPQDLIDAARVDGASEWTIFSKIMLPLIAPWLATVGILTAVEAWNEYIWPSIVMSKPDEFPLSVGVLYLRGTFGSSTRVIAAGTIITIVPTLAAFLFTQRFFMRGMDGAVK